MRRNMEKIVSDTKDKIPNGYQLTYMECVKLVKMAVVGGGK